MTPIDQPEDDFPTHEEPTRPTNEQHRANRMIRKWARLSESKRKLMEMLFEELVEDEP